MKTALAKGHNTVYQARQYKEFGEDIMFAVIAIGVTVAIFGLLNLIDYHRLD